MGLTKSTQTRRGDQSAKPGVERLYVATKRSNLEVPKYTKFVRAIAGAAKKHIVASGDPVNLAELVALGRLVDDLLHEGVDEMRNLYGFSWRDIGDALGIDRNSARHRFGHT